MKFKNYLQKNEIIVDYLILMEGKQLNEMSNDTFETIKKVGKKLGVRIKKSDTVFTYLKKFGRGVDDLIRLSSLYLITDITDSKSRKDIVQDAKNILKGMNKKEIAAFIFQLDKATVGITAHLRHIMQSIFGLEVATYNNWMEDIDYIKKELRHIKTVLKRMGNSEKELKMAEKFEKMILNMEKI